MMRNGLGRDRCADCMLAEEPGTNRPKAPRNREAAQNRKSLDREGIYRKRLAPLTSDIESGWGARIRTWEWRNQNQFDHPTISMRIWKTRPKWAPAISTTWQPFPNPRRSELELTFSNVAEERDPSDLSSRT